MEVWITVRIRVRIKINEYYIRVRIKMIEYYITNPTPLEEIRCLMG